LASLGSILLRQRKWTGAELVLREALAIRDGKQPGRWTTFNTKSMLGGALLGQRKYDDAEPLLMQGYAGLKECDADVPAAAKFRLHEAADRLVELYTAWGKSDEAAKWRAERAKHPFVAPPPRAVKK
jgi:hypothetical protein